MRFIETRVSGAYLVNPEPRTDERGFFSRLWSQPEFAERGLKALFVQCNNSFSIHRGTLRGLHYQVSPHLEAKLVRCVRGAVFDALVDLRPDSPTFLRWAGATLSADNRVMMYVPEECAHGYVTLEDSSEVIYGASHAYHPESERGIRWNDPRIGIEWPSVGTLRMSTKDELWPDYLP